jgi:hypothetical protein
VSQPEFGGLATVVELSNLEQRITTVETAIAGVGPPIKSRYIQFKASSGYSMYYGSQVSVFTDGYSKASNTVDHPRGSTYTSSLATSKSTSMSGEDESINPPSNLTNGNVCNRFVVRGDTWTVTIDLGAEYIVGEIVTLIGHVDSLFNMPAVYTVDLLNAANEVTWSSDVFDLLDAADTVWVSGRRSKSIVTAQNNVGIETLFSRVTALETVIAGAHTRWAATGGFCLQTPYSARETGSSSTRVVT